MKKTILTALLIATPALAVTAPRHSIASMQDLPVATMHVYDEGDNADALVAGAFDRAKKSHKRVLIDLGGNWCGDCIILANFFQLPEIKRFMAAHYEIAQIDVGRFNKNLQVPARFGFTKKLDGVPTLLIANPDGTLVNKGDVFAATDARNMTPQSVADYFAKYAK